MVLSSSADTRAKGKRWKENKVPTSWKKKEEEEDLQPVLNSRHPVESLGRDLLPGEGANRKKLEETQKQTAQWPELGNKKA